MYKMDSFSDASVNLSNFLGSVQSRAFPFPVFGNTFKPEVEIALFLEVFFERGRLYRQYNTKQQRRW